MYSTHQHSTSRGLGLIDDRGHDLALPHGRQLARLRALAARALAPAEQRLGVALRHADGVLLVDDEADELLLVVDRLVELGLEVDEQRLELVDRAEQQLLAVPPC